jgi:hypothetical protein
MGDAKVLTKEDAEQLDELSTKTLKSYSDKAAKDVMKNYYGKKEIRKAGNRSDGRELAYTKIQKAKKIKAILNRRFGKGDGKESVSQSRREDK